MISLLFLTRNRFGVTARCFRSLAPTLRRDDVEWCIINNGGDSRVALWLLRMAARYPGKVRVELHADNTGVAGGRQLLLDMARGDRLVFLDNDVEAVRADWLDTLLQPLERDEVGLCGPAGHWLKPGWEWYEPVTPGYVGAVDVCSGYCQAFRRDAIDGFQMDMAFNPFWHEDSDMCLWLKAQGRTIWCTGNVGIQHVYAGTGDTGGGHAKQAYLASKWAGRGLVRFEREAATV